MNTLVKVAKRGIVGALEEGNDSSDDCLDIGDQIFVLRVGVVLQYI
jgi:hypothetical protein